MEIWVLEESGRRKYQIAAPVLGSRACLELCSW